MFFATIVETLLVVTSPDSNMQKPAAIHMTRKPHTKKENVLKIYCTSAETVVSALPKFVRPRRKTKLNENVDIIFVILVIRPPV